MANLFNLVLSSFDDENNEEQQKRQRKFKQQFINYFDKLELLHRIRIRIT